MGWLGLGELAAEREVSRLGRFDEVGVVMLGRVPECARRGGSRGVAIVDIVGIEGGWWCRTSNYGLQTVQISTSNWNRGEAVAGPSAGTNYKYICTYNTLLRT